MKKMKIDSLGVKMVWCTSLLTLSSFTYAADNLAQPTQALKPSSQIHNSRIDHGYKNHPTDNTVAPSLQKHDYPQNKPNVAASAVAVACNTNAYATSGNALLNTIKTQGIVCLDGLFGVVPNGAFTEANIMTVANEARSRGGAYNGVDTDDYLTSLHYWIRAFYYQGNRANLT
ncbi:MAG: M9 family metallopeptidase N-terminal domain-containing protein, partial [Psychrosphaera sp.]|nr:M9 family metallopeptidase N-terminal domain-containing protein [Psychrosphaera sp.]